MANRRRPARRKRGAGGIGLAAMVVMVLLGGALNAQTIQITPLTRDGRLLVSFRLADVFSDEIRDAIHSGMNVTFHYEVELRRGATLWLDRTMDSAIVATSVRYDTLTRKYHYTRMFNGRTERAEQTVSYDTIRDSMTVFEKIALFNTGSLERNSEYYVRVRARTTPRNVSFAWPWSQHDVMGQVKFTFLPH